MAKYVDGFIIPIQKNKVSKYKKIAAKAGKLWMKYGAIEYFETVGVDIAEMPGMVPFKRLCKLKKNETVVLAWIVYKSKAHRVQVLKKVMNDPWITGYDPKDMPIDMKRMSVGGFNAFVALSKK